MTSKIDDGEPAFPQHRSTALRWKKDEPQLSQADGASGMSLRDWFAGQALAGCEVTVRDDMGLAYFEPAHEIAKRCFEIADAMIADRKRRT